jgi:NADH-quinone oxidoreductase subunit A
MKLVPDASDPVATLVFFLFVFTAVGVVFLFMHLVMGSVIRPKVPDPEKLTIYECGEPTVGSAWIQFDLRFYVVALLFVIFDVEVAFFFPWATVFGKANQLAHLPPLTFDERKIEMLSAVEKKALADKKKALIAKMTDAEKAELAAIEKQRLDLSTQLLPSGLSKADKVRLKLATYETEDKKGPITETVVPIDPEEAARWGVIALGDILVFFGVLLVGFAYLWRRGDIDWVRAFVQHTEPAIAAEKPAEQEKVLV